MKKILTYKAWLLAACLSLFALSGCKDYLEIPLPIDQLATDDVFSTRPTILAATDGMYNWFGQGLLQGFTIRITYWLSDEGLIDPLPGTEIGDIIRGNLVEANTSIPGWSFYYPSIYRANELLERLPDVPASVMPETEKQVIIGAAKYVRAATHFFLANTWGDVPLTVTTDAQTNIENIRTPVADVYAQVVQDQEEAAAELPATVNSDSKTIHNRYQALALLTRVYLYQGRWAEAEAAATEVINSGQYDLAANVVDVFKRGSRESIFSFGNTSTGASFENRTVLGWITLPFSPAQALTTYCHIPSVVLDHFEPGDQRNISGNWTIDLFGKTFANKYLYSLAAPASFIAANPQDFIYQRLAEVYLIRAEARAQQGKLTGDNSAASDLNAIRIRAGLTETTAATQPEMLAAIEKERVCELFYEGHRWYDLKRTGKLDEVLGKLPWKAENYKPYMNVLPVPLTELNANPRINQNPGY